LVKQVCHREFTPAYAEHSTLCRSNVHVAKRKRIQPQNFEPKEIFNKEEEKINGIERKQD
jgi:hypothetical protein